MSKTFLKSAQKIDEEESFFGLFSLEPSVFNAVVCWFDLTHDNVGTMAKKDIVLFLLLINAAVDYAYSEL